MHSSHLFRREPYTLLTLDDARAQARRRLPRMVFDFVEGAAGREIAAAGNVDAFTLVRLQPRVLADVAERSLCTSFLGTAAGVPFGVAPMGMCNLVHPQADALFAAAARRLEMPMAVSTAASTSLEDMARLSGGQAWFQLYAGATAERTMGLVERARAAGYTTLVLTADVPVLSRRVRDLRNGFTMPFRIGPRQALDFALHPGWSLRMLRAGTPYPANYPRTPGKGFDRGASRAVASWEFLDRLRQEWPGRLIVKGVTAPSDAVRLRDAGADAVWVSNHGGRQLDAAPPAITCLPPIRAAVGPDYPLVFDSGVRSSEDVVKALASGANLVMLGRPFLHALGAAGERGLATVLDLLAEETSVTMAQIGARSIAEIGPHMLARGDGP